MELTALIQSVRNCADEVDCPTDCPMKSTYWKRMGYAACKPFTEGATYVPTLLLHEILAQLEKQVPKLMTLEELRGYDGPLWIEWRPPYDYDSQWALRDFPKDWTPEKDTALFIKYRYWTAPPSKEQAKAVEWE